MPVLVLKCPRFYSPEDERHFFGWLTDIAGVGTVRGIGRDLHVSLRSKLSQASLRELLSLYKRYGLPMAALAAFCNASNAHWFRAESAYWHRAVFGHTHSEA
jgi:hypothetical protein